MRIPCSPPHYNKDDQAIVDEDGEVDKDVAVNAIEPAAVSSYSGGLQVVVAVVFFVWLCRV